MRPLVPRPKLIQAFSRVKSEVDNSRLDYWGIGNEVAAAIEEVRRVANYLAVVKGKLSMSGV